MLHQPSTSISSNNIESFYCSMVLAMSEKLHQRNFEREILVGNISAKIGVFKFNNINTRKRCKICSKLTIKTPERRQCRRSDGFIVNFDLKYFAHFSTLSCVNLEQVLYLLCCDAMNLQKQEMIYWIKKFFQQIYFCMLISHYSL